MNKLKVKEKKLLQKAFGLLKVTIFNIALSNLH